MKYYSVSLNGSPTREVVVGESEVLEGHQRAYVVGDGTWHR